MPRIDMQRLAARPAYDVVVSGAGPTGLTTALALRNSLRADGRDPRILVTESRGPDPTRFQILNLKPDAAQTLRDVGLGHILDGEETVRLGKGWWSTPIRSLESRLRTEVEQPGSGIDILYDTATTGLRQAADGAELLQLATRTAKGAAQPAADDARAGAALRSGGGGGGAGTTVRANLLAVVAEGGGSHTARDILGIRRTDDTIASPMAVGRFDRNAGYTAAHGEDKVRRWIFRDPDGAPRTMVVIDHHRHGTTAMLHVPSGTTRDDAREVLTRHAAAVGLAPGTLVEGPTVFEARGAVADRAIAAPDRRVIVAGDYNGASTPNSGSNFGTDLANDVPAAVAAARALLAAGDGTTAAARQAREGAMRTYDAVVVAAHRAHMVEGRTKFSGQPGFPADWGPELPAPPPPG